MISATPTSADSATNNSTSTANVNKEIITNNAQPSVNQDFSPYRVGKWTVTRLKEELRTRNAAITGTKEELIERLENLDRAAARTSYSSGGFVSRIRPVTPTSRTIRNTLTSSSGYSGSKHDKLCVF